MKMRLVKNLTICSICAASVLFEASAESSCVDMSLPPFVAPLIFTEGQVETIDTADASGSRAMETLKVTGCCSKEPIGEMPQMSTEQSIQILQQAKRGWNNGNGKWTQMTLQQRIAAIEKLVQELMGSRDHIVHALMHEIGKNQKDAAAEFDRTIDFIRNTIEALGDGSKSHIFQTMSSSHVMIRRNGFGIVLALGPYNYPLNETYATIIPALLMGNVVILKIPQVGGLAHLLTFQAFSNALPPNTISFISGSGRKTLPPLMESGDIDGLAFIGGTSAADTLIQQHPYPHRLKLFLQLEAKNMAIVLPDIVSNTSDSNDDSYSLSMALDDIITGALSYNGQRCTALKIIFVPRGHGKYIAKELAQRVDALNIGMPWKLHDKNGKYSEITPLPNKKRVEYMQDLIDDARSLGAIIANDGGGKILSDESDTLMKPAVLYAVTPEMRLYREEQFGPIIPVVEYDSIDQVLTYGLEGIYGQQVSIFTSSTKPSSVSIAASIIDTFSAVFGKINVNSQCGRSPDSVPFSARRSSGLGVMSIEDALKEFSVPTVVSYKHEGSSGLMAAIQKESKFMSVL